MSEVLSAAKRGSLIRVLPDRVANQIAAGEVVERPVAVVKELVENSLDAGATRVEIEFRQGGKRLIRVEDNGCGMSPDDAMLALERHATSKIREAEDLNSIQSFGFRGEALPSIASVSRFCLRTRAEGWEHGTEVVVNGGRHLETREVGMPVGTCIEVSHLFNSVPARRKFLKTDKTEAAHIVQLCRLLAIAHPEVSFSLIEDGRRVFQSPVCPSLQERIGEIFGRGICQDLIELRREQPHMKLSGLIGRPGVGRSTRQDLICYVNNRPVESRTLTYALIEGYHTYIPKGRYPLAFLFLEIEPHALDVNVHPAKREVRFRDEGGVRRFVIEALLETLDRAARGNYSTAASANGSAAATHPHKDSTKDSNDPVQADPTEPSQEDGVSMAARLLKERGLQVRPVAPPPRPTPAPVQAAPVPDTEQLPESPKEALRRWRYLGGAHGDYAVFESPDGIVCLNRRNAQVRVLYEDFLSSLESGKLARQSLLFPITFELDPLLADVLETHAGFFRENGFDLEAFGGRMFMVEAVPAWFESDQCEAFVRDAAALIEERGIRPGEDAQLARQAFARLAASRAARTPPTTNEQEMMGLLKRLLSCGNPVADPYGKPTFFELPKSELARRFGQNARGQAIPD